MAGLMKVDGGDGRLKRRKMNYIRIAVKSPEVIIWSDTWTVTLKRNVKTHSVGIKLETFKSHTGAETYTLVTVVKPECSVLDRQLLDVEYRIKFMNGQDITRFKNTGEIKHLISDSSIVKLLVCKPVGLSSPINIVSNNRATCSDIQSECSNASLGQHSHTDRSGSRSDGMTLNLPSMSSSPHMSDLGRWEPPRVPNGFPCVCRHERPPSTLDLGPVSDSIAESIPLRELHTPQNGSGDMASVMETPLLGNRQVDYSQEIPASLLLAVAVKYPHKIRYDATTIKLELKKNSQGRLGFSYTIKPNQTSYQRDTRNESWVYDYLVDSVKAPPARGLLQVGDLIQSVNREPMQQRSDERLKEIITNGGDVVTLVVQRPQSLCSELSEKELEKCRTRPREMSNNHAKEPGDAIAMETGDVTGPSSLCSGVGSCRRRAATTMTRQMPNLHLKNHRRSQSDSSVLFYQQVFQDGHGSEPSEALHGQLVDSDDGVPMGMLPHAQSQTLLSKKDLLSLLNDAFESLASVTLKRVPLVRLLVLSVNQDNTTVETLLRSSLFLLMTERDDVSSTVVSVDRDGCVNDQDTQIIREFLESGVTVGEIILAKHIAYNLRCHQMGLNMLQVVAASLMALPIKLHGVGADVIGRLLYHPLRRESDIVEVTLECLSPTVDMWPAARFTRHAVYFITFDLDAYLSQPEELQQVQRQLNVVRSYAGHTASVVLITNRHDNSIEDVTKVAQELDEMCCSYRTLLCNNSVTDLPLFVQEDDDWSGRDFRVLETTLFDLVGRQQPFVTGNYPLAAVVMRNVLLRHQKVTKLKTMSVSQLQWQLYKMFGNSSGLLQRTLVALHHSGVLSYHDGISERLSADPILDMFVLVDLLVVEQCIQLLCQPCRNKKDAWQRLLKTGFTDRNYLLGRLQTQYFDSHEIIAFLELYHAVFLSHRHHQYLVPYHLKRWCSGGAPQWCMHTLYVDFHGHLPVYLGCHIICGLAGRFGTDSEHVEVHSKNSATFSSPRVKFSVEMLPTWAVCKVLVTFKTTEYKPYMVLADLTEWIRNVVPPDINHHVGPLCPNSDCTTTASEVHVLNLDQSQPVYCCDEPVSEDDAIQQWVVPPVSEETATYRKTEMTVTMTTRLVDLPEDLFILVCDELRVCDPVEHKDWRGLAGKLGITHKQVELYKLQPDPCVSLLHGWGQTANVQQLLDQLDSLRRPDLVKQIREYVEGH